MFHPPLRPRIAGQSRSRCFRPSTRAEREEQKAAAREERAKKAKHQNLVNYVASLSLPWGGVAAMQGRIAMWHFLGDTVHPLDLKKVSSNVFTAPEIATVGYSEQDIENGVMRGVVHKLPLAANPRAKSSAHRAGRSEGSFMGIGTNLFTGRPEIGQRGPQHKRCAMGAESRRVAGRIFNQRLLS